MIEPEQVAVPEVPEMEGNRMADMLENAEWLGGNDQWSWKPRESRGTTDARAGCIRRRQDARGAHRAWQTRIVGHGLSPRIVNGASGADSELVVRGASSLPVIKSSYAKAQGWAGAWDG
ncbi:hypothetical protein DFH07DRAFT_781942 [Mycena maculata]|uniref:Uncharacterized protein n=1 Tax=Mycena maculata TaxID=230809 RepID=A0AAD7HVM4_9AGAR|nr:hypothetical protein DFH07DRAFT_781942 [Mycena maculata]